jgi:2-hydroxychromene-2-carboxylate isomerase
MAMTKTVDFYYDFGSPASYLAYKHLPAIASRAKAEVSYRPFLLGGVFKSTGNRSPVEIEAKGRWMWQDLGRYARRYGVDFNRNPHFPINTLYLMRGAYAVQADELRRYCDAIFQAIWVDGLNLNEPKLIADVLVKAEFDSRAIFAAIEQDDVKNQLKAVTEEAIKRGAFGAPTFFVGDQIYFGQDRLDFVAEALTGKDSKNEAA